MSRVEEFVKFLNADINDPIGAFNYAFGGEVCDAESAVCKSVADGIVNILCKKYVVNDPVGSEVGAEEAVVE